MFILINLRLAGGCGLCCLLPKKSNKIKCCDDDCSQSYICFLWKIVSMEYTRLGGTEKINKFNLKKKKTFSIYRAFVVHPSTTSHPCHDVGTLWVWWGMSRVMWDSNGSLAKEADPAGPCACRLFLHLNPPFRHWREMFGKIFRVTFLLFLVKFSSIL